MSLYLGTSPIAVNSSSRNIGEIIQSTIPLSDAGLHLLDGGVISGSGAYSAFVTYIAGLVSNYPDLFETEANWQSAVTTYGVCGKFVYNSTNNTVRLPKITGIVEGTTDLTALGDLVEAGLPNITGVSCWAAASAYSPSGAFYVSSTSKTSLSSGIAETVTAEGFKASRSNSIYGNSSTVQPQAIKVLYYIVIATTTKTDIQVDIDEIATDLNGKADVDLSNCTKPHIVETYVNGTSWYRVYSDGWCEQGGFKNNIPSGVTGSSVVFLKKFSNTNYFSVPSWGAAVYAAFGVGNRTTTGMTIYNRSNENTWCYWEAKGYIS